MPEFIIEFDESGRAAQRVERATLRETVAGLRECMRARPHRRESRRGLHSSTERIRAEADLGTSLSA